MREKTGKKNFFSCILKKNCEGKLFSQVAGVLTGNVLKNGPFKKIFEVFIKIYGRLSGSCNIKATCKPRLARQLFQVAGKTVIRKEVLKTFKSILKC